MQHLLIFNPDSDLALAQGGDNYTAPPFARRLADDLATLPLWLARPGDVVLTERNEDAEWIMQMSQRYGLQVSHIMPAQLSQVRDCRVMPWGWNATLRKRLIADGLSSDLLPTDDEISTLRSHSHRRTSIAIHQQLSKLMGRSFSPLPVEISTLEEVKRFAALHLGCYCKAPWSSSGRGVMRILDPDATDFEHWCHGVLRRQGSVLCEVALHRTMDFALEFWRSADDGSVTLAGYSIFQSDRHNQFSTGMVAPEQELHDRIADRCPEIDDVAGALCQVLSQMLSGTCYEGYLGVDMLLYRNGEGEISLDPCVELNLRTTMGAVTARLGQLGLRGGFKIMRAISLPLSITMLPTVFLTPDYSGTDYLALIRDFY